MTAYEAERFVPSATDLTIRFADVDMMRVVHHCVYVYWLEQIRFRFAEKIMGIQIEALVNQEIAFPLVECGVKYVRALTLGDKPIGYGRIRIHRESMFSFHYCIYNAMQPERLSAVGFTTHCYLGPHMDLLLRPPKLIQEGFARAQALFPDCVFEPRDVQVGTYRNG